MKTISIDGQRFGRLTAIIRTANNSKHAMWLCRCECGIEKNIVASDLLRGAVKSCGCAKIESMHGHSKRGQKTATYSAWESIRKRCSNNNHEYWSRYGGRGITVCERWQTFLHFLEDMGEKPDGLSLDRIDNNKGYYKENCKWSTVREQSMNTCRTRLIEYRGEIHCVAEWERRLNLSYGALRYRLSRGWPIERALTKKAM